MNLSMYSFVRAAEATSRSSRALPSYRLRLPTSDPRCNLWQRYVSMYWRRVASAVYLLTEKKMPPQNPR